jgi:hypothetical protein
MYVQVPLKIYVSGERVNQGEQVSWKYNMCIVETEKMILVGKAEVKIWFLN